MYAPTFRCKPFTSTPAPLVLQRKRDRGALAAEKLTGLHLPIRSGDFSRTRVEGASNSDDLTSPRFSRLLDLEAAYDSENVIRRGSRGRGVEAIQQALYDLGFSLRMSGVDGEFGRETEAAVRGFQKANPPLAVDGQIGPATIRVLDKRFASPVLPPTRSSLWEPACVRAILCPWTPHTVNVLREKRLLRSADQYDWNDERWSGTAWEPSVFKGRGHNHKRTIGIVNDTCERVSEVLYHEVLHDEQPASQRTTQERESYAYRIGEEFNIAMGLAGTASFRSDDSQGRKFADPKGIKARVSEYPGVPADGSDDQILGRGRSVDDVKVRRRNGTTYYRRAEIGEKVSGELVIDRETTHSTIDWTCP